jgi:hypothetical protein
MELGRGGIYLLAGIISSAKKKPFAAFHAFAAFFWDVTQSKFIVFYRCFETKYRIHLQGPSSPRSFLDPSNWTSSDETTLTDYQSTLRNIPEEQ